MGKNTTKKITDVLDKSYYDQMHQKMQTRYAKKLSRIRKSTVEPVLGTLINFLNMKRVNSRGIKQASKHVLMAALCYNLKKYMNFVCKTRKSVAMEQSILALLGLKRLERSIYNELRRFLSLIKPMESLITQNL